MSRPPDQLSLFELTNWARWPGQGQRRLRRISSAHDSVARRHEVRHHSCFEAGVFDGRHILLGWRQRETVALDEILNTGSITYEMMHVEFGDIANSAANS